MSHDPLFSPLTIGDIDVPNRVLMAPLTRNRAQADGTPNDLAQLYYGQRAAAGFILTEATQISAMGKGYKDTPGIYSPEQIAAWRRVTDAVHAQGGRIVVQLWHVGRISHSSLLPDGRAPVSSTATRAQAQTFTENGFEDTSTPEALTIEGIQQTLEDYRTAARAAKAAGFDGVEVHAANGYLLDQFLQDGVNDRTDAYGGSLENRMRFLREVIAATAEIWPRGRIGVRLSPLGQANDVSDSDPEGHFGAIYEALGAEKLAFLHVVERFPGSDADSAAQALIERLRARYDGTYIANGGYDASSARDAIQAGHADAVTFGRPFIANPDLPERFRVGAALNDPDQSTFYGGGSEGYTDYPALETASRDRVKAA